MIEIVKLVAGFAALRLDEWMVGYQMSVIREHEIINEEL